MRMNWKRWLAVCLWMAVIWSLSSIPSLASDLPMTWDFVLRKIAHATEFGVLTLLIFWAIRHPRPAAVLTSVLVAVAYAGVDEYHQSFVRGRTGTPIDVVIDGIGIALAGLLLLRRYEKKKQVA